VGNESDIVNRAPFAKLAPNKTILMRYKNSGVPKIRGIQRKRYNNVFFGLVSCPDWIFSRRRKKSGLIYAIGRRKSA
jgi:hypothetical protein